MDKPKLVALPSKKAGATEALLQDAQREMEVDILARTLWGEARGEGKQVWKPLLW